ncbi:cupin domain-containing protein [Bradyrhizobium prioriisuperbiae]|uniref:cupin domain-containing protein n=1 Tax=Bradyrhizobium prioriisuperbiae TaxID=2854389 RepID=UPI0028EED3EB|nr:cupin domain-containing protein [Bradyrhizobium prioritasuperba]
MPYRIRRVVTGHDKDGKSKILMDGLAPNILEMASMPGVALTDLWRTKTSPASNIGNADTATGKIKLEPPESGTILRIVEFPPDKAWRDTANAATAFKSIGAGHAPDHASGDPMMHTTATVDYIIVLQGAIYAIMDNEETLLEQGDILIQRGTNHSWSVRGDEPCIVAAVLVGAKPVGRLARAAKAKPKSRPKAPVKRKNAAKAVKRKK